ncbi:hypothetical protein ACG873_02680 [Mesorhizobium sp. AaZ16]|uniref:hypothetical protein n=1 Tax=Mesorhizobium sp. AaZ16 TaxID=3402289 RepID=UPI00374F0814
MVTIELGGARRVRVESDIDSKALGRILQAQAPLANLAAVEESATVLGGLRRRGAGRIDIACDVIESARWPEFCPIGADQGLQGGEIAGVTSSGKPLPMLQNLRGRPLPRPEGAALSRELLELSKGSLEDAQQFFCPRHWTSRITSDSLGQIRMCGVAGSSMKKDFGEPIHGEDGRVGRARRH